MQKEANKKECPKQAAKDIFERLKNGEIILPSDPEAYRLREESYLTKKLLVQMNNATDPKEIKDLLTKITGSQIDESVAVFTPLYINYGKHTKIGKNVFINFDCVFLDLGGITIEDGVLIAQKVSLLTEGHSISPSERHGLVPRSIHIKKNAWIGANATILQGVTIGENSVVAAGSVVSKDVPDNVVVGGTPAKSLRKFKKDKMRRILALAVFLLLFIGQACKTKVEKSENTESSSSEQAIFPKGEAGNAANFTGNAYNYGLVANDSIYNTLVGNVYFEKSARSNWHLHPSGQILIVLDGLGYHQLEGQPRETMKKGDVIKVPANTRHWHGATENNSLTQMYILPKTENGFVTWLEPVTDEQYTSNN